MGRRKIAIQPLTDERNRSVTFLKRKAGLFKKAHELAVLCQVEIAVIIVGNNQKLYEFSSGDTDGIIKRYKNTTPQESKGPDDFDPGHKYSNKTRNTASRQRQTNDNKAQSSDEEDAGDDDDDEDSVGTPPTSPKHSKPASTPQSNKARSSRRATKQATPSEPVSRNSRKGKRKSSEQEESPQQTPAVQYTGATVYHMEQRYQYPPENQQSADPRRMAPSQAMGYGPPYGQTNPPYGYYAPPPPMAVAHHTRGYSDHQLKISPVIKQEENSYYSGQQRPHSVNSGRPLSMNSQTAMIPANLPNRGTPNMRPKTKPKLKVQIPQGENNENISSSGDHQIDRVTSSPDSKIGDSSEGLSHASSTSLRTSRDNGLHDGGPVQPKSENGSNAVGPWGSLLPPPSPSSYMNPQGGRPGNPFSGRPPLINSNGEQTPISAALPSKYVNDLLPSPSNFYGSEWNLHFGPPSAAPMSAGVAGPGSAGNPPSGHPTVGIGITLGGVTGLSGPSGASNNGAARSAQSHEIASNPAGNEEKPETREKGTRTRRKPAAN